MKYVILLISNQKNIYNKLKMILKIFNRVYKGQKININNVIKNFRVLKWKLNSTIIIISDKINNLKLLKINLMTLLILLIIYKEISIKIK